jgi:hypothetical protein
MKFFSLERIQECVCEANNSGPHQKHPDRSRGHPLVEVCHTRVGHWHCSLQLYQPRLTSSPIQRGQEAGFVFSHSFRTRNAINNCCFKPPPHHLKIILASGLPGPASWSLPWFPTTSARQHYQPNCPVICRVVQKR